MDYGKILKEGWHITWNNKFLWLLGFIAALGGNSVSGNGGGGNTNFSNSFGGSGGSGSGTGSDFEAAMEDLFTNGGFESLPWDTIGAVIGVIVAIVLCLIVFRLIMYFIRFIAEAGMIQAAFDIANGQTSNFQQAFSTGRPFMLPMFGMRLILSAPIILVVLIGLVIGGLTVAQFAGGADEDAIFASMGIGFAILGCFVCLLVPYGLLTSLLYPVAQRGMVLRGMSIRDSLWHGWDILKNNVGEMLLLGVIFVVVGIIVGIIAAIILIPVLLAFGAPAFFALMNNDFDFSAVSSGLYGLIGVGVLVIIFLGAGINAIAVSYRSSTFTLAYIEFMNKAKLQAKSAE